MESHHNWLSCKTVPLKEKTQEAGSGTQFRELPGLTPFAIYKERAATID